MTAWYYICSVCSTQHCVCMFAHTGWETNKKKIRCSKHIYRMTKTVWNATCIIKTNEARQDETFWNTKSHPFMCDVAVVHTLHCFILCKSNNDGHAFAHTGVKVNMQIMSQWYASYLHIWNDVLLLVVCKLGFGYFTFLFPLNISLTSTWAGPPVSVFFKSGLPRVTVWLHQKLLEKLELSFKEI